MAEISLTQDEADALIAMEKRRADERTWRFEPACHLAIPLFSSDRRHSFFLDITRGRIKLSQASFHTRTHQSIPLMRQT
jgi:hypothetical protein